MQNSKSLKGSLLLLLTAAIWGFAFVAQSVGMNYVGGFTFNCTRNLIGAFVLLPFILLSGRKSGISQPYSAQERSLLLKGGLTCGFFLFLASNFQQFGIKYTTVGKAGFITALYIVIVPVIGIFLKKKSSPYIWAAVILSLCGLYLLCISPGESFSIKKGDMLVIICAFLFSFQILAVDHYAPLVSGIRLAALEFLVCGILSGIPALFLERPGFQQILAAWLPILYAGALSSGIAYTLQIIAQRDLNPAVASLIMSLESSFSVLAGFLILHQKLSRRELIGCAIMFSAIILAQLPHRASASADNTL